MLPLRLSWWNNVLTIMEHWSKRLNRAIEAKGWKPADLMRVSGVSKELIYKYVHGKVDQPRLPVVTQIANTLGVSVAWLTHGDDLPLERSSTVGLRRVPVLTLQQVASLGPRGRFIDAASGEFVPVPDDAGPRSAGIRINDDAGHPVFQIGDIIIVDPDVAPVPGRYVLAIVGGVAMVRRYRPTSAAPKAPVELVAEHRDFPTVLLTPDNGYIVGRVVKRISDI